MIEHSGGDKIRIARWIGQHDNNVAEYTALLEALQYALDLTATELHVFSDSEVMVRQMKGEYACRRHPNPAGRLHLARQWWRDRGTECDALARLFVSNRSYWTARRPPKTMDHSAFSWKEKTIAEL